MYAAMLFFAHFCATFVLIHTKKDSTKSHNKPNACCCQEKEKGRTPYNYK